MPVPVVSVDEMRQWEQESWRAGCSQSTVIARVGQITGQRALRLTRAGDTVLILAGKGHNGDDARCAQFHLPGRPVELLNVSEPGTAFEPLDAALARKPALIIDGLFGIGLNRPLDGRWIEFIERINNAAIPVLAVDVPSGLNADTGETEGAAIYAHVTLTLGAPKRGMLHPRSYAFAGRVEVAPDIGLSACPIQSEVQWTLPEDFAKFPPPRRVEGHKGTFGHVAIVAGSLGYHGASVLCSRGALRARPGLVSLFCPESVYIPAASQSQAAMVHPWKPGMAFPESCSAVVLGPGMAGPDVPKELKEFVNEQWQNYPLPVVVDASALAWIKPGPTPLNSRRIITPHPGEAARMLGTRTSAIQENRVAAVREISSRYGNCWVILKGHQSLVGRSSGEVFINPSGNPFLAQGGSGDVLAGFLGGLIAQPRLQPHPLRTIRFAVWEHGAAADRLSESGCVWTVENLLQDLGNAGPCGLS